MTYQNIYKSHKEMIEEILLKKYNDSNEELIDRMTKFSINNQIVDIYTKIDFDKFMDNYEEQNQGTSMSKTGDYFCDNPSLGTEEFNNYVVICM